MDDRKKTQAQLLQELTTLRRRVAFQAGALRHRQNAALTTRIQQMEAVRAVTIEITRELHLPTLLRLIIQRAVELIGAAQAGTIHLWDETEQVLTTQAWYGVREWVGEVRLRAGEGVLGTVAQRRQGLIVDNYQRSPYAHPIWAERLGPIAIMVEPLLYRERLIGVITVSHGQLGGSFTAEDQNLLALFAAQTAIAIEQARLVEAVQQQMTGLEEANAQLQALSQQLVETQEAERRAVARELHDEIGQDLSALKINLQALERGPGAVPVPRLADSIGIVDDTIHRVRELALALRPALLDDLGLVPALRWYVDQQAQRAEFTARFVAGSLPRRLPRNIETACFRIVQEALTNIMRHAQAHQVQVSLYQRDAALYLMICDDGIGFDVAAAQQHAVHGNSMGLLNMRERALLTRGQFAITSAPRRGTEIRVRFLL